MNHFRSHIVPLRTLFAAIIAVAALIVCAPPAYSKPGDKLLNRPYADLKRWHLGFSVAAHVRDLSFTHNGYVTPEGERWVAEGLRLFPWFLRERARRPAPSPLFQPPFLPGMYFGSKAVEMIDYNSDQRNRRDVKSAYVTIPLDLKISGDRMRNVRPYVTTGVMGTFDVSKSGRKH